ncbi:MAG TPA: hypothetical protein EYG57_19900 [Planctomycetes bacterium]|nr:hypothetical protein [Planctomycetaceae bacterium]HIM31799.1 hypothetical protein [Planctomycetota bacterium]
MWRILWAGATVTALFTTMCRADEPFQLVSAERGVELRAHCPQLADEEMQAILMDPATIFYTDEEVPPCYQEWDGGLRGIHSVHYNISANRQERFGNGNREFPWADTGGLTDVDNVGTVRFLFLPLDPATRERLPIVWYRKTFLRDAEPGYGWRFPAGTVFGEVLLMHHSDERWRPFEVRIRQRETDDWDIDVFRPFSTPQELATAIRGRIEDWRDVAELQSLVTHLDATSLDLPLQTLENEHPTVVFRETAMVDSLPTIGNLELVDQLLRHRPFHSVRGEEWRRDDSGNVTYAPTTEADDHIIPRGYRGGFIEISRSSCMRCHETANRHVRDFQASRDWYGRIRGGDGIFSFHPFSLESISPNGYSMPPQLNPKWEAAGLLLPYDPDRHQPPSYGVIETLDK